MEIAIAVMGPGGFLVMKDVTAAEEMGFALAAEAVGGLLCLYTDISAEMPLHKN